MGSDWLVTVSAHLESRLSGSAGRLLTQSSVGSRAPSQGAQLCLHKWGAASSISAVLPSRLPPASTVLALAVHLGGQLLEDPSLRPCDSLQQTNHLRPSPIMTCVLGLRQPFHRRPPSLGLSSASSWHPTPVLLPGKSHGRRSLVGCSPWGC